MKKGFWLFFAFAILFLFACKSNKKSLSGTDQVAIVDFMDVFPDQETPLSFGDTILTAKDNDSLLISREVFSQFVPDSVLKSQFPSTDKLRIYPIFKSGESDKYLFTKVIGAKQRAAYVLAFNKEDSFIAAMPLFKPKVAKGTEQVISLDQRSTLTRTFVQKDKEDNIIEGRDVFVLNNEAHVFTLIMTDALDNKPPELVNPIDTFSRKEKYSADYGSGKNILFSFRDGRKKDRTTFFIYFEKDDGNCRAELKGEAIWRSPTRAVFQEPGDPCSLEFEFTTSSVVVKELTPCGNYRSLRCLFDGKYAKMKKPVAKDVKKKTAGK